MPKEPTNSQKSRRQNLKPPTTNTRKQVHRSQTRLCACGCGSTVVARTERRHLEGKVRPTVYAKRKANASVRPPSPEPGDDIPGLMSETDSDDEEGVSDVEVDSEEEKEMLTQVPRVLREGLGYSNGPPHELDVARAGDWEGGDAFNGVYDLGENEDIYDDPHTEFPPSTNDVEAAVAPVVNSPSIGAHARSVMIDDVDDDDTDFGPQLEHVIEEDIDDELREDVLESDEEEDDPYDDEMDIDELEFARECAEYRMYFFPW